MIFSVHYFYVIIYIRYRIFNMELTYKNKKTFEQIINSTDNIELNKDINKNYNYLITGENLSVLKYLSQNFKGKIDLIYIDPPFATNNVFRIGKRSGTISCKQNDNIAYADNLTGDVFFEFLRERLIFAKELLSEKGSIYLHIDYKIGHYIKILMDEIFGIRNFRNDITRIKCNPKNFKRTAFGNIKDLILFYSKTQTPIWNEPKSPYSEDDIKLLFKKIDKNGRRYTTIPLHAPGETKNGVTALDFKGIKPPEGRHWRCSPAKLEELDNQGLIEWSENGVPRKIIYADERDGKKMQDIWEFKDPQYPQYPTEKNIELLQTIINASSNKNSIILDFFCGSGTTLVAADTLERKWIGIDISPKAIQIAKTRIENESQGSKKFMVLKTLPVEKKQDDSINI